MTEHIIPVRDSMEVKKREAHVKNCNLENDPGFVHFQCVENRCQPRKMIFICSYTETTSIQSNEAYEN